MRILGLDIGEKRIGLAIAHEKMVAVHGVINLKNLTDSLNEIGQICRQNQIEKIIIGIPKSKDSLQIDKIHKFALELAKFLTLPIEYVDESFTSLEAERLLIGSSLDPKSGKYKEEIDKISAKLILEQYLSKE